jgi:hypothetical protein
MVDLGQGVISDVGVGGAMIRALTSASPQPRLPRRNHFARIVNLFAFLNEPVIRRLKSFHSGAELSWKQAVVNVHKESSPFGNVGDPHFVPLVFVLTDFVHCVNPPTSPSNASRWRSREAASES